MSPAISLIVCAVILIGGCSQASPDASSSGDGGTGPGSCAHGPWADHCPEAEWARLVLSVAGYPSTGDTGSALLGRAGEAGFYFWAFEAEKSREQPLPRAIEGEGYRSLRKVGKITVFSDGTRLAWQTQGLYVWLEGGPTDSLDDVPDEAVRTIVTASAHVSYP